MNQRRTLIHALALTPLLAGPGVLRAAPREVHGASDTYAEPGLSLAWAVLQAGAGADPGDATVVLTIELDVARFPQLDVQGRDPLRQRPPYVA